MSDSLPHLVIGTPCYGGQVTGVYLSSVLKLQRVCLDQGIPLKFLMPSGDSLIPRARQDIVSEFLSEPSGTHLLFIDADIGFEPEQVFRLLRFNAQMAAGLYPLKRIDWDRMKALALVGQSKLESASLSYVLETAKPEQMKGDFLKARWTGTGFLLVQREVFTQMIQRYPELKYVTTDREAGAVGPEGGCALFNCLIDEKTGLLLSEDFSFCRRWTDMGGEVWVDLQSRLDHVGHHVFRGDVAALLQATLQAQRQANPASGEK